jgi:heat shock protein HslJ
MASYHEEESRAGRRVTLAWVVLALQIIGLLWLLLFARDQLAAMFGAEPAATVVATQVAAVDEAAAEDTTADTAAAEAATANAAATTDAAAEATAAAETTAAESAAEPTAAATAEMPVEEDDVIPPDEVVEEVAINTAPLAPSTGAPAPEWLAQIVRGEPSADANNATGLPPHLLLTFRDPAQPELELAAPDAIDLNRPQIRIVPIAALLAWLQARGDSAGQDALEELQSMLDDQPAAGEASMPMPPIISEATQALVARMAYETFHGGRGVGYVTHVTGDDVTPVTNESGLNYVYQGVTEDGRHYVFMAWPVEAAYLAEPAADAQAALASDPDAYYGTIAAQVEEAPDDETTPALSQLWRLAGSLAIGATAVRAVAAQPTTAAPEEAAGIVWNWTGSRGGDGDETAVENPTDYALIFWPDGTFSFVADCNVGRGGYEVADDGALTLTPGAMTRAACPPGSQDAEFLQTLPAARALAFDESGDLILTLADGREAVFANGGQADTAAADTPEEQPDAADAGFTGLNLQWPGFSAADGSAVEVDDPEAYSLVMLPDGTYTVRADCNVGAGTFEYDDDGALALLPGPLTRVACPAGSHSDAFLSFLNDVSGVAVADDGTVTMTTADGSRATFISAGPVETAGAEQDQTAAESAGLTGVTLQWPATDADGNPVEVDNPADYFLVLWPDGTFNFQADCNVGAGTYTYAADGALTLMPGAMTRAACPAGSQADAFLAFLGDVTGLTPGDDGNPTLTTAGGGSATFVNTGSVAAQPEAQTGELLDIVWQWTALSDSDGETTPVENPERYTLTFLDDGAIAFVADCNSGAGTYTLEGMALTLQPGAMTAVACAAGSLGDQYVALLGQVAGFTFDGDDLLLSVADGPLLRLVNGGPFTGGESAEVVADPDGPTAAPLAGVWRWATFRDAKQEYAVPATTDYTLAFNDDGTVAVVADCNSGTGTYTVNSDGTLTIVVQVLTRAACPPGSLSDSFIEYLNQAGPFEVDDTGTLIIDLMADGGRMTFVLEP